jgi:hypothetical protein
LRAYTSIAALLIASAPLHAQRNDIEHRFSIFVDGSTAKGSTGVLDNVGAGASLDLRALANVSVRVSGAYDRVTSGPRSDPNQYLSTGADLVLYPVTDAPARFYVFGGIGYAHQAEHTGNIVTQGAVVTQTTSANSFLGAEGGFGMELGGLFLQYRIPPRPRTASPSTTNYSLISLGIRF